MPGAKMHDDELDVDGPLVRRLIAGQFPEWAGLPVTGIASAGTDHAMFRLGDDLVVRLPRRPGTAGQVAREQHWLPRLAPDLPLAVPVPLGLGAPAPGYGHPWSVLRWLAGRDAHTAPIAELGSAAVELGRFVAALRKADATGGPVSWRGGPVAANDRYVRAAIRDLGAAGAVDPAAATALWEEVVRLPQWDGEPVWLHGDLLPGNLLTVAGRLTAVIDFGGLGVGDPAADTLAAWAVLTAGTRGLFREASGTDATTWARGRGWALCFGLMAEHYYRRTNPVLAAVAHRTTTEALADHAAGGA
ncbi:aminoglycoside phosphotransferase family protein [Streptomyces sp. NPDC002514]|uniref:aminoglycoside phosphotransferase family protein n=1 Tax=Streptomyces sp. NPDC001270 TaxID=3364554 RepID=UPI00369ECBD2